MHTFAELGNVSRHLVCLTREITTNLYEKWGACYPLIILRWESLFSCWNSLQPGLYQSPVGVWNLKFYLPNLQLLEGSLNCCSKTSSLKTIYFKLSLFHVIQLHHGKQGSWGNWLLLWPSWTIVLALLVNRFCPSLAQDVSQLKQNETGQIAACFIAPNWRGCMQSFINLQLVLDWSYWKVSSQWEGQETFEKAELQKLWCEPREFTWEGFCSIFVVIPHTEKVNPLSIV